MNKGIEAKITDTNVALAVIAHESVSCFCGSEQKRSKQPQKITSCTGGIFWGKSGEQWPTSVGGEPLIPWLQIVCTEMNGLSGAFFKKRATCFYLCEGFEGYEATSSDDRSDFVVREYLLGDSLAPLDRPSSLKEHPFRRVVWEKRQDFPSISKYFELFDKAVYDSLCETTKQKCRNNSGIKIGGWPTPVQRDQQYPGSYDLQIDMTQNFMYGDSGIGYLSRSDNHWHVMFECC